MIENLSQLLEFGDIMKLLINKIIQLDTPCEFEELYKGCWKYSFEIMDETYYFKGGRETYEAAYELEISRNETIGSLIEKDSDMSFDAAEFDRQYERELKNEQVKE